MFPLEWLFSLPHTTVWLLILIVAGNALWVTHTVGNRANISPMQMEELCQVIASDPPRFRQTRAYPEMSVILRYVQSLLPALRCLKAGALPGE